MTRTKNRHNEHCVRAVTRLHRTVSLYCWNTIRSSVYRNDAAYSRIFVCYNRTNERTDEREAIQQANHSQIHTLSLSVSSFSLSHSHTHAVWYNNHTVHGRLCKRVATSEIYRDTPQSERTIVSNAQSERYTRLACSHTSGPYAAPLQTIHLLVCNPIIRDKRKWTATFSRRTACPNFFFSHCFRLS